MGVSYVIVDLETTGLSPYKHTITEIAAVRVKEDVIVEKFQTLVKPQRHIPSHITTLTGITDEMVKDAPILEQALQEFLTFLGDDILVAHNAQFDVGFLQYHAKKLLNHTLENQSVCTRKLASRLLPELRSKRLSSLCEHFEIKNEQAHRAMSDVKATFNVMQNFLGLMEKNKLHFEHTLELQHQRIPSLINNRSNEHQYSINR